MKLLARVLPIVLFLPVIALAQATTNYGELSTVETFLANIVGFINNVLVPLIFALAFLVFIWGMFKTFILGGSDEGEQAKGKQLMLYGIVGFVVMLSLWGIVNLIAEGFGFNQQNIVDTLPVAPLPGGTTP